MTLLESLVALVIVGLFAIGVLETLQVSTANTRQAADWATAVAYADATMEEARLGTSGRAPDPVRAPRGFSAETGRKDRGNGLDEITVRITMPNGSEFLLQRLAPR